jgi:putative transposase
MIKVLPMSPYGCYPCPSAKQLWRRQQQIVPSFAYPPEVRTIIYATIESLDMRLRTIVKNRGHFPTDEAPGSVLPGYA